MPEYDTPLAPWLQEGANVVVLSGLDSTVHMMTVAKLTKRDIVLSDGSRWRHKSRRKDTTGSIHYARYTDSGHRFGIRYSLYAPQAQEVIQAAEQQLRRHAANRIASCIDHWHRSRTVDNAQGLQEALAAWIALESKADPNA